MVADLRVSCVVTDGVSAYGPLVDGGLGVSEGWYRRQSVVEGDKGHGDDGKKGEDGCFVHFTGLGFLGAN